MKIEVNKIMNPAFLLGTAFNIAYWHRKYHSGTICKGVSNPQTSNALSGCEKEEIPKWVWRRYRQRIRMKPKKSFRKMKGKNGILLFVFNLKGLKEEWKWRLKKWRLLKPHKINGKIKWKRKNLFNVGL